MKNNGNNQSDVKYANQRLIVTEILKSGKLARTDLAKRLSLSNPSVSKNVGDLLGKGVLVEIGAADTVLGRKPVMLSYNSQWGCVAAVDLGSDSLRVALGDMSGQIIEYSTKENIFTIDQSALDWIVKEIKRMVEKNRAIYGELLEICIGTPGDIDKNTGYYIFAPRLVDAKKLNIRGYFEENFGVPTIVNNDINLAAKGENLRNGWNRAENLVYVYVDYGIGSGLILDGKLYEGKHGFAGEIGLMVTDFEKFITDGGKQDYHYLLDSEVSIFGIKLNVKSMIESGGKSSVMRYCRTVDDIEFKHIIEGFSRNDEICRKAVNRSALYLSCALKNIVELLDLERIIIGGSILLLGDEYLQMLRDYLKESLKISAPEVLPSALNTKATIYGAINDAVEVALERKILGD